jgi:tRNA modification GTPase
MDTIYALASARGRAGVAVVRLSGPGAFAAVGVLAGRVPAPRRLVRRDLWDGGQLLDQAMVVVFPAPASFTGEDVAEVHLHGGVAVVAAVLRALGAIPGLRLAGAGEFTRRAFENGRIGLVGVEGLGDLIDAETEAQRRVAMAGAAGRAGEVAQRWREALVEARALLEAMIDFADEEVPVDTWPMVVPVVERLLDEIGRAERDAGQAERVRDGFEVAIVGAPNVGKSTLLNALAGREAAITSDVAGTTRDVIEVRMDIGGLAVTLLDTAGLREASDPVERIGIARTRDRAAAADLRVFLVGDEGLPAGVVPGPEDLVLRGKADLGWGDISGTTGAGVDGLLAAILARLEARVPPAALFARERHRLALALARRALESARDGIDAGAGPVELVAESMRVAAQALAGLIGEVDSEAVLGAVFARFCIGK